MSKIVAIHQPNYIPYLGYFYKMLQADVFVLLDTVQYPRGRHFGARNRIKTPQGETFLTIPVSKPKTKDGKVKYTDIMFAEANWPDKHLKTLTLNYKKAPYFDKIINLLLPIMKSEKKLVSLNIALIRAIADYLNIDTQILLLSDLLNEFGRKNQLIVDICKATAASAYLSGTGGGREYNDPHYLEEFDISLKYSEFEHPQYGQLWGSFIPNLSIIDLLFNEGENSGEILSAP